jgi:hypothetical protein
MDFTPISRSNALHRTPPSLKHSITENPTTARQVRTHPSHRNTSSERSTVDNDYPENEFEPRNPIPNINYNIRARQAQRPRVTNELKNPIQPPTSTTLPPSTTTSNPTLNLLRQVLQSISQSTPTSTSTATDTNVTITHQRIQQLESRVKSFRTTFEKIYLFESRYWPKWQKNLQDFIITLRMPNILSNTYEEP